MTGVNDIASQQSTFILPTSLAKTQLALNSQTHSIPSGSNFLWDRRIYLPMGRSDAGSQVFSSKRPLVKDRPSENALPRLTFQSDPSENPPKSQFVK